VAGVDQNVQSVVPHVGNAIIIPAQASNEWDDVMLFRRALTKEEIQGLFYTRAIHSMRRSPRIKRRIP